MLGLLGGNIKSIALSFGLSTCFVIQCLVHLFILDAPEFVQCLQLVRNIVRNYNNCKSSVLVSNQIPD